MEIVSPLPPTRSRIPNPRLGLFITGLIIAALVLLGIRDIEWFLLKKLLRYRFPRVRRITTEQLATWLGDKTRIQPVLLDVRTKEEWNVSHLLAARLVTPSVTIDELAAGLSKEAPIVTYCAVGYRSAAMANKLQKAGFSSVMNLEGSIFQWANEHRPLVRDHMSVTTVHPFSKKWGRLLRDEMRAPLTN